MSTDAMTATVEVAILAPLVETFEAFRQATQDPHLASPAEEDRKAALGRYAATYSAFARECLSRGLNETTVRALLGERTAGSRSY